MPGWLKWALLSLWALSLLAGMLLYSQRQLTDFDPSLALSQAAASPTFDAAFVELLKDNGVKPGSIVHLQSDAGCYCNQLTAPHKRQLSARLGENYQLKQISLDASPALQNLITAFPAVAIVDKQGVLRYLGPYATGYGCFTGATLVDFIARAATATTSPGAIINAQATGCFCQT
ncbi:DUF6436 domain-containing protein [Alteromonas halophila]|uniref:DUF6436 domain-containing protein n=1 Tax=Alteromonas halophila TaxID=516698 RepID=A0A918JJH9_9ALTE|nr:DUF6436 domain-containing protein [Alteromonas halophila]GGW84400.1 hypothetical protein GCM10007391_17660 [Alteromonas halophila]